MKTAPHDMPRDTPHDDLGRPWNFGAGPAMLPAEVLARVREELLDWQGSGMSVMEMNHRGPEFGRIAGHAEESLRRLLRVPDDYHVLFLQGGARAQFSMVPLNLMPHGNGADYVDTGHWSAAALAEGARYGEARLAASTREHGYRRVPRIHEWRVNPGSAFVHYTPNETIGGLEFHWIPDTGGVPLVADMSSTLLSRPLEVSRLGIVYACAQKNIGPAGLTVVIVRDELVREPAPGTPMLYRYRDIIETRSMANTPPTFAWYVAGLVFDWLHEQGGLDAMAERNRAKAAALYAAVDGSGGFYVNEVEPDSRSWMNVPFRLAEERLDGEFLAQAAQAGLTQLKGHRSVGGMRASLYNAMPPAGVDALIDFMDNFRRTRG